MRDTVTMLHPPAAMRDTAAIHDPAIHDTPAAMCDTARAMRDAAAIRDTATTMRDAHA